jgi:hypothetical protein
MRTRNLPGGKERPARKADNLTAIREPIVYKMWEPHPLTTLWTSKACYRDSLTSFLPYHKDKQAWEPNKRRSFCLTAVKHPLIFPRLYSFTYSLLYSLSFFLFGFWGYWHCGHSWPIVPASGDSEDDYGEADGMLIGRENRSSRRKPAPAPLLSITKFLMTRPGFEPGRRGGNTLCPCSLSRCVSVTPFNFFFSFLCSQCRIKGKQAISFFPELIILCVSYRACQEFKRAPRPKEKTRFHETYKQAANTVTLYFQLGERPQLKTQIMRGRSI